MPLGRTRRRKTVRGPSSYAKDKNKKSTLRFQQPFSPIQSPPIQNQNPVPQFQQPFPQPFMDVEEPSPESHPAASHVEKRKCDSGQNVSKRQRILGSDQENSKEQNYVVTGSLQKATTPTRSDISWYHRGKVKADCSVLSKEWKARTMRRDRLQNLLQAEMERRDQIYSFGTQQDQIINFKQGELNRHQEMYHTAQYENEMIINETQLQQPHLPGSPQLQQFNGDQVMRMQSNHQIMQHSRETIQVLQKELEALTAHQQQISAEYQALEQAIAVHKVDLKTDLDWLHEQKQKKKLQHQQQQKQQQGNH